MHLKRRISGVARGHAHSVVYPPSVPGHDPGRGPFECLESHLLAGMDPETHDPDVTLRHSFPHPARPARISKGGIVTRRPITGKQPAGATPPAAS